jgi:hypothetical protein
MTKTLQLGKVAYSSTRRINAVELELNLREREDCKLTVDLEPVEGYTELSICGGIWNGSRSDYTACGQMIDEIAKLFRGSVKVRKIAAIWRRWHLNGMKAGTRKQNALVDWWRSRQPEEYVSDYYGKTCAMLEFMGWLDDGRYRYGTAWLVEPLPVEVIAEVKELFGV